MTAQISNTVGRSGTPRLISRGVRALARRLAVHENVSYGREFRVGRGCVISSPHGLEIGDFVSIGPRTIVQVDGEIGDFSLIGMGVQIVGRDDHAIDELGSPYVFSTWVADRRSTPRDSVTIGRDVWIGGGSTVLSGIEIGDGALIGAGAVVAKNVPAFAVVGGNPARVLGERFRPSDQSRHLAMLDALSATLRETQ